MILAPSPVWVKILSLLCVDIRTPYPPSLRAIIGFRPYYQVLFTLQALFSLLFLVHGDFSFEFGLHINLEKGTIFLCVWDGRIHPH